MPIHQTLVPALLIAALGAAPAVMATSPEAARVQQQWDEANFVLSGEAQKTAMEALVADCERVTSEQANDAELLTWCGIANSSYAGLASSFSAMKYAKAAKGMLERAIELSPGALRGAARTSLGTLYFKVPGWPIGFGDSDLARELPEAGLRDNPEGMDANFFYADFLLDEKETASARKYLEQALNAPARPGREVADDGRRAQIQAMLARLDGKQR